jgi:osmotically-inducible protein OsmY
MKQGPPILKGLGKGIRDAYYTVDMASYKLTTASLIGGIMILAGSAFAQTQPDNTAANKGDQSRAAVTADSQKMNAMDRDTTAKIRRELMADKSLSTYAHNVKVIAQNGVVTLRGPVRSDEEMKSVVSHATDVTGTSYKIVNELSVKLPKQ